MGIRQNPYNQISQLTVRPTLAWWKWQFSYVDLQIQWISSFLQFCDDFSQYGFHSQSVDVHSDFSSSTLPTFLGVLWILNCKDGFWDCATFERVFNGILLFERELKSYKFETWVRVSNRFWVIFHCLRPKKQLIFTIITFLSCRYFWMWIAKMR